MNRRYAYLLFAAITFVGATISSEGALAEPQALGLVATKEPVMLQCQYGRCAAFLSAFCLEEKRSPPYKRTPYRLAAGTDITLLVTMKDGQTLRLAGNEWLTFRTNYIYTSVTVSVDEKRLAQLAPVSASVQVGKLATLIPVPFAGDDRPHSAAEIAMVNGLRKAAEAFFGAGEERSDLVALTAQLINSLPRFGRVLPRQRNRALAGVISGESFVSAGLRFRHAITDFISDCRIAIDGNRYLTMRACLELKHSEIQIDVNADFWKSLAGV